VTLIRHEACQSDRGQMTVMEDTTTSAWTDSLVPRVVQGEREAWRAFHEHFHPVATAFLRRLGVSDTEMEDACQDVFLQAYRYLPRFRGDAEVKTWFYRLCVSEARQVRRRGRISRELAGGFAAQRLDTSVPAQTRTREAILSRVAEALRAMNDSERLAFVLFEIEGVPGKEIAEISGCPEPTVWRRLHHARRTFRELLD
jgi:RNA polymerase sigma-70 factor, ECF subfamily